MAYVLSLPASCPLDRPFAEPLCGRSQASVISRLSSVTVRHSPTRRASHLRRRSQTIAWPLQEQTTRLASQSVLDYIHAFDQTPAKSALVRSGSSSIYELAPEHHDVSNELDESPSTNKGVGHESLDDLQHSEDSVVPFPPLETHPVSPKARIEDITSDGPNENSQKLLSTESSPFRRWLSSLRRRRVDEMDASATSQWLHHVEMLQSRHEKSSSLSSSTGVLTAVKSATLTLAGTSIAPTSRYGRQGHLHSDNASSNIRGPRLSVDSASPSIEVGIDGRAWYRSIQRRNIVEEIVQTEESYIGDMKAMVHVYFTLLASAPSVSPRKKESVRRSMGQIIQLHEELLTELQAVVSKRPNTSQLNSPPQQHQGSKHTRWLSADHGQCARGGAGRKRRFQRSMDLERSASPVSQSMVVTTHVVFAVAKIFGRFMRRFLAYEAYVAYHELIYEDANATSRFLPSWPTYERGMELLSASINALDQKELFSRKGLTFADLGIKPIQRICKYPLFFADLCKHTPACDDPIVHAELEKVLSRLQETAKEIDFAMDNPQVRRLIEITWMLQDRLTFREESYISAANIRHLGHVVLCGALHVAYESTNTVHGQYTICILYRYCLVLASVGTKCDKYLVNAIIPLYGATVEAPDDGRGLQCQTALHTWKLCFLYKQSNYELLISACSDVEEDAWTRNLRLRIAAEAREAAEGRHFCTDDVAHISMKIKPIGPVFDVNIDLARGLSVQRAATVGQKTNLRSVIIKNTHAPKPGQHASEDNIQVSRSKSHMSSTHIPTLAPRRAERVRLEGILAEVWTRDSIPYPGMAVRRSENTIRASANSVMRKLSMASIASNFSNSKKSGSFGTSISHGADIGRTPSPRAFYHAAARSKRLEKRRSRAAVVDFHSAPNAFLPEDFELKRPTLTARSQNFVKRAMTMESSRAPEINLRRPTPPYEHKRSCSMSAATNLVVPASISSAGEETSCTAEDFAATKMQMRLEEDVPRLMQTSVDANKSTTKAKSKLFKMFGVSHTREKQGTIT